MNINTMASDAKRILRNSPVPLFCVVYATPGSSRQIVQFSTETLTHALESEGDSTPPVPAQRQDSTLAPPKPFFELLDNAKLQVMMRRMLRGDVERIKSSRVKKTVLHVAINELLDPFHIGFESADDVVNAVSFHFLEQVRKEMTRNGAPDKVFNLNIELWTNSSTFIGIFARLAIKLSQLEPPGAKVMSKSWKNSLTSSTMSRIHESHQILFRKHRHYHLNN